MDKNENWATALLVILQAATLVGGCLFVIAGKAEFSEVLVAILFLQVLRHEIKFYLLRRRTTYLTWNHTAKFAPIDFNRYIETITDFARHVD